MRVNAVQTSPVSYEYGGDPYFMSNYSNGGDPYFMSNYSSPFEYSFQPEQVNFDWHEYNPYSDTFNPEWENQPNYSWINTQYLPEFLPLQENKPSLEDIVNQLAIKVNKFSNDHFITNTEQIFQNQAVSIQNPQVQVSQIANTLAEGIQGALSSTMEADPLEYVQAITLKSGREVETQPASKEPNFAPTEEISSETKEEENTQTTTDLEPTNGTTPAYVPLIPISQRKLEEYETVCNPLKAHLPKGELLDTGQDRSGGPSLNNDEHSPRRESEPGQQVLLCNSHLRFFPRKLKSRWFGPFTTQVSPCGTVEVNHKMKDPIKVNGRRLKRYIGDHIQKSSIPLVSPT